MSEWKIGQIKVTLGPLSQARPAAPPPHAPAAAPSPEEAAACRAEGDRRRLAGDVRGADQAYARAIRATLSDPELVRAADALCAERFAEANSILQGLLARRPSDPMAVWLLAEVAVRIGRSADAERLLARALELAPDLTGARYAYALALYEHGKPAEAVAQADILLAAEPRHPVYRHIRAANLVRIGEYEAAAEAYAGVLEDHPDQPLSWMSHAHVLKTLGRRAEAVAAYRRALELRPSLGEAWWSLANLKTVRLGTEDAAAMEAELARPDLSEDDRLHLHFALGKACEDLGRDEEAFGHYARGNAIRRPRLKYDAEETSAQMRRAKGLMSAAFFAARAGQGCPAPDPIFIVGLPRSGSTLIEQILASHSAVEGTQELPDIMAIAARLAGPARRASEGAYPDVLAALEPQELKDLGEEYLSRAEVHRKLGRPFFIDKTPNNFEHIGLIQLILPNAKVIDARRHPLGCCFSAFKQHFAEGQTFSYDLTDLGRYYRDYVELMAHFDAVLPGRIHRTIYEEMVADPEAEVRRLLDHCGLPFEEGCLRFYENERAVRTASSEQVRQPIFTDAAEHWRRFEPWLGALKTALGPVLETYPRAPAL